MCVVCVLFLLALTTAVAVSAQTVPAARKSLHLSVPLRKAMPGPAITDADWTAMVGHTGVITTDGAISSLAFGNDGSLYLGGSFTIVNNCGAKGVAKWNGGAWTAFGTVGYNITALAVDGSGDMYAGGQFDTVGGITAKNLAVCKGGAWSALGSGTNGTIANLACNKKSQLYVYGEFDTIGGIPARNIAVWRGNAWSALGAGAQGINALVCDNNAGLYVAGAFDSIGGVVAKSIAQWNGAAWSALSSGNSGQGLSDGVGNTCSSHRRGGVYSFANDGNGNLYVGGDFVKAGGLTVNSIAKWNGSTWDSLGSGIDWNFECMNFQMSGVFALATDRSGNLYAGGEFHQGRRR